MDTGHFYRTALCERRATDSVFNEMDSKPNMGTDPNDPNAKKPAQPAQQNGPSQASAQPSTGSGTTAPAGNAGAAQPPAQQQNPAQPAGTPPAQPNPTQKAVSSMSVSGQKDSEISPGVILPANTPASITPGDLSGNVTVTFAGNSYKVPDSNLKQMIKMGGLKVDTSESMSKRFLNVVKASGI